MTREQFIETSLDLKFYLIKGRYGILTAIRRWSGQRSVKIMYNYDNGKPYYVVYVNGALLRTVRAKDFDIQPYVTKMDDDERYK